MKILIKYFTLVILFLCIFLFTKTYGEYCSDIYIQVFAIPILGILTILNILILYLIDSKKKKFKTTNRIVLFLFSILFLHLAVGYLVSNRKEEYIFEAGTKTSPYRNYRLELFKNNTYEIIKYNAHHSCHYKGKYKIEKKYLKLSVSEITNKTDDQIDQVYTINNNSDSLIPLKKEYLILKKNARFY